MMIIYRCVLVRTLLDRYATCSSSKDVVKAQDKWLEEMEEEQNAQSSQGFFTCLKLTFAHILFVLGLFC